MAKLNDNFYSPNHRKKRKGVHSKTKTSKIKKSIEVKENNNNK